MTSSAADVVDSLAAGLNRRCHCVGTDVPALQSWLSADLHRRGLQLPLVESHPHLFSASPVFVARDDVERMRRAITAIEDVIALPAYRSRVLSHAPEIARHAQRAHGVFFGYDFHLSPTGPQLIEVNTNAGGALLNVAMMRAQQACCAEVFEYLHGQPSPDELDTQMLAMFQNEWRLSTQEARPLRTIAIVDEQPQSQYLYPEFLLFARLFESAGIRTVIAAPEDLAFHAGALWFGELRIDMVYNRLTDFYLERSNVAALKEAYLADAVVMTPHPYAHALYANKHNLSLLSNDDELRAMGVDEATRGVLCASIPRTVPVASRSEVEWWRERKQWFFKPASGFGGKGSYRGDKLTKSAFADVLSGDYIAQQCVPPSERWLSDELPLKFDVRNFVYDGAVQLLAARLYQGQTTNFRTTGGGFAPVYSV